MMTKQELRSYLMASLHLETPVSLAIRSSADSIRLLMLTHDFGCVRVGYTLARENGERHWSAYQLVDEAIDACVEIIAGHISEDETINNCIIRRPLT